MSKQSYFSLTVLIQTIQFSISIVFVYTQLNIKTVLFQKIHFNVKTVSISKTVPFQTNQFSIKKQFYFTQFSLAQVDISVLFDSYITPYQVLPLWVRVDLEAMAMKEYSVFPKAPGLL